MKTLKTIYLDNAATTRVTQPVLQTMIPFLTENYGNPSANYRLGRQAREAVEYARKQFAKTVNAKPEQIFFTSGATESNNIVIRRFGLKSHYSPFEHPSCQGVNELNTPLSLYEDDIIKVITNRLNNGDWSWKSNLVCWQAVNSETGYIFPVGNIAQAVHETDDMYLCDMTAAWGHIPIDLKDLDVDFATFSGHKLHAPKGVGVLYIKDPKRFRSDITGGGQEHNLRSGTENVASIVAMAEAAMRYKFSYVADGNMCDKRKYLLDNLNRNLDDFTTNIINPDWHVPNIVSISIKDVEGDTLRAMLDSRCICISTGTACHSQSLEISPILKKFYLPADYEHGTIRISMSRETTYEELDIFIKELVNAVEQLRAIREGVDVVS